MINFIDINDKINIIYLNIFVNYNYLSNLMS